MKNKHTYFQRLKILFNQTTKIGLLAFNLMIVSSLSCKKFVTIDPPKTELITSTVFTSDVTATATISAIYDQMSGMGFSSGDLSSLTYLGGLSSDELNFYSTDPSSESTNEFYINSILPTNYLVTNMWSEPYQYIYKANAIIEGLASSSGITQSLKTELEGEAKFIRAFAHFYLVNLFGDIPYITSTDYQKNALAARTPGNQVYAQIIADLKDAQSLLVKDYSYSGGERVRPNSWTATALLARAFLYTGDWANAEIQSSSIINDSAQYSLVHDPNQVFLANSNEAIWQLMPIGTVRNTWEAGIFILSGFPTNAALSKQLVNAFEPTDNRKVNWLGNIVVGTDTFYYPFKYKVLGGTTPIQEYSMVFRVAEQYLIRAEARAMLNDFTGAAQDLNMIRARAGLANTLAGDQASLSLAIEHERQVELFTEWGHRWLDLKRTNRADIILSAIKSSWKSTDQLYPIPLSQLQNDPSMTNSQNPGY